MRINGSTVLITGASMGIGAACAIEFARQDATVLLAARNTAKLDTVAAHIAGDGGAAYCFTADLSTLEGVQALADAVRDAHGTPDILVNNAGTGRFILAQDTTPDEFAHLAAVPYLAAGYLTTAFLPEMVARKSGHIAIVNSPVSRVVWPSAAGYASARWALRGLVEGLRADLRGTGVGVTEIIPGEVSSQYFVNNPGSAEKLPRLARMMPVLTPEKVATTTARAVASQRKEVIFPFLLRLLTSCSRLMPRLVRRMVAATSSAR